MPRIIHASDLHGSLYKLPEADLYIITGDVLPNFPDIVQVQSGRMDDFGHFGGGLTRKITPEKEERLQNEWFKRKFAKKKRSLRYFLGSPEAPVVVVRGNHDFTPLAPMFGGEVYEIGDPCLSYNVCGLDIGGFRGINYIEGEWADETDPSEFYNILRKVPTDLDVMVTHSPPLNILDGKFDERWGVQAYAAWITEQLYDDDKGPLPKLFCFGHIHNDYNMLEWDDGTIFSNAATSHRMISLNV